MFLGLYVLIGIIAAGLFHFYTKPWNRKPGHAVDVLLAGLLWPVGALIFAVGML